jgi:AcrR family transcriptional regulator
VENLLDVATAVFLKHGYENASVSEIARRACASKGTIYARFPTKADLFAAVITRRGLELHVAAAGALVSEIPLKKVLGDYGVILVREISNSETRSLHKVVVAALGRFPKLANHFWDVGPQRSMNMLGDYLARRPEFKGKNSEHAAEMFWSLCCGQSILRALLLEEDDLAEEAVIFRVREATRIFLSAYT